MNDLKLKWVTKCREHSSQDQNGDVAIRIVSKHDTKKGPHITVTFRHDSQSKIIGNKEFGYMQIARLGNWIYFKESDNHLGYKVAKMSNGKNYFFKFKVELIDSVNIEGIYYLNYDEKRGYYYVNTFQKIGF